MRHGLKWAIGLLCVLAVLICGAYRWPIGSAKVSAELNQAISPRVGMHWRGPARATLALLPWPTLRVVGVELVGADGKSLLNAPDAQFPLSLAGLLRGRFIPVSATMRSPTAFIDLDAAPVAAAEERALSRTAEGEPPALWSHVRLYRGVLHIASAAHQIDTLIESLDGSFDWPSVDKPMSFTLAGAWRDERVTIEGGIDNPQEGLERRSTGVRLAIASSPLSFTMAGTWSGDPASGFSGDVSAQVNSLRTLERLFGAAPKPLIVGDTLSLTGKAQTNGASLAVSDAQLDLAGQKFEGALTIARESARTAISGTLAADSLNIEPLFGAPPTFLNAEGAWSAEAFRPRADRRRRPRPAGFRDARRLARPSHRRRGRLAHVPRWATHRDAARSRRLPGRLERPTDAGARGERAGDAIGRLARRRRHRRGFRRLRLERLPRTRRRRTFLCDRPASRRRTPSLLSGAASLDLQAGVIDGVNIEEAMRRSQRRPIDVARDMAIGQTHFSRGRAQLTVANGAPKITEARIEGPGSTIDIDGVIDIAAATSTGAGGDVQADAQGAPSADAARLTIVLSGPWSAPTVSRAPGG